MPVLRRRPVRAAAATALVLTALTARADTLVLRDGDRISGKVAAVGKKAHRVVNVYGRLLVPNESIDKIVYDDGHEEVIPASAAGTGSWRAEAVRLSVIVAGDSFWQAWDPKDAPADPTLRFLFRLDSQPVAAFVDGQLDHDIRGAVVNTFAFDPNAMTYQTWEGALASPPVVAPGRALVRVDLPTDKVGHHTLSLAYQMNAGGGKESAEWVDVKSCELEVELTLGVPVSLRVEQSRQQMSFGGVLGRPRMRHAETFRMQAAPEAAGDVGER